MNKLIPIILLLILSKSGISQTVEINTDFEKGKMTNGHKEGPWEYYDVKGELAIKINYTNSRLIYLKVDTGNYVLNIDGKWTDAKTDRQSRYIGSMHDFDIIEESIKYPQRARETEIVGTLYIVFEVDTNGIAGNFKVWNDIGNDCSEEVLAALDNIPNYWIPARLGGKNYSSRYVIPVHFNINIDGKDITRDKPFSVTDLPIAKQLREFNVRTLAKTRISDEKHIHSIVEEMPSFPGGEDKLMQYIMNNIKAPNKRISGRVYLTFIVTKTGEIENVNITKSLNQEFDEEAIRVIKSMPKWEPGKQNGKAVNVQYNMPILFR